MARPVKLAIDPVHTEQWIPFIGRLIANFGVLELQSYWWITALTGDPDRSRKALKSKLPFKTRVSEIEKLLDRNEWSEIRATSGPLWSRAKQLADIRNGIAHSPLAYFVEDGATVAQWVGIPDVGRLRNAQPTGEPLITLDGLREAVVEVSELAQALYRELDCVDKRRGTSCP